MYINAQTVISFAALISACTVIAGLLFSIFNWISQQKKNKKDIQELKKETFLLTYGILACLKGLKQLNCNGPVTEAMDTLEKHMNKKSHDQEESY